MNWFVFSILAYAAYALQVVLAPLWSISGREPLLLLVVSVFVALQASPLAVAWSAAVLGVLADVFLQQHEPGLIGPWALGFLVAGYVILRLRNLLLRDSALTVMIMTLIAGVLALLTATAVHFLRTASILGNAPAEGFSPADQLYRGFMMLLYTAAVALPAGSLLLASRAWWGFHPRGGR